MMIYLRAFCKQRPQLRMTSTTGNDGHLKSHKERKPEISISGTPRKIPRSLPGDRIGTGNERSRTD
jgi:hypothetical protein